MLAPRLRQLKGEIVDRLEPYLELEDILQIEHQLDNPIADRPIRSEADAEAAANYLRLRWKLGINPIPNTLEMLEDQGVKVILLEWHDDFDGLSSWVDGKIPVIIVNYKSDLPRMRFTALHELAHLLLQFDTGVTNKFKEKCCNRFAGAMLLPAEILLEELGTNRSSIAFKELISLKEYFGISIACTVFRLIEVGVATKSLKRRYFEACEHDQDLKMERKHYGTYRGRERSVRFQQLLAKAYAQQLITLSKASELSNQPVNELQSIYKLL